MGLLELQDLKDLDRVLDTCVAEKKMLVVDCYATWCGPCKKLTPVLEELNNELDDVTFVKVNVGESDEFADLYQITSIPTLKYYVNGRDVETTKGALSKEQVLDKINDVRANNPFKSETDNVTNNESNKSDNESNENEEVKENDTVMCEEVKVTDDF